MKYKPLSFHKYNRFVSWTNNTFQKACNKPIGKRFPKITVSHKSGNIHAGNVRARSGNGSCSRQTVSRLALLDFALCVCRAFFKTCTAPSGAAFFPSVATASSPTSTFSTLLQVASQPACFTGVFLSLWCSCLTRFRRDGIRSGKGLVHPAVGDQLPVVSHLGLPCRLGLEQGPRLH